jgi:hypothetical protein
MAVIANIAAILLAQIAPRKLPFIQVSVGARISGVLTVLF